MEGAVLGAAGINNVAPRFLDPLQKRLTDCIYAEKRVKELVADMRRLTARRDDRKDELHMAIEDQLGDETNEAGDWFKKVEDAEEKVKKIDRKNRKRRFFNFWSSCKVSEGAVEEHNIVKKLLQDENNLHLIIRGRLSRERCQEIYVPSNLVGVEAKLRKVLHYVDEAKDGTIIGLWGMVGVGKTTLLKCINNAFLPRRGRDEEFDYVIYFKVSKEYKLESFQEHLAGRLGLTLGPNDDPALRKQKIFKRLADRSFLLLLDDLWEKLDLDEIKIPSPLCRRATTDDHQQQHRRPKHQIVFTTNFKEVCSDMEAQGSIEVERLSGQEALRLFEEVAGKETNSSHSGIQSLSNKVAAMCNGLPEILTAIGQEMSSRRTFEEWSSAYANLRGLYLPSSSIYSHYRIHFEKLAEWKRKCFLSCSMWPGNHDISKPELIKCWMGLGFFSGDITTNTQYDTGHSLIEEFKILHLLESGETPTTVRMTHIARKFALSVDSESGFGLSTRRWLVLARAGLLEMPNPKDFRLVECMSFMHNHIMAFPRRLSSCLNLKTLVLKGNFPLREIPNGVLPCMKTLEYLDLSYTGLRNVAEDIGELVELQYLNLSCTYIRSFPKQMAHLEKLKCLIICQTRRLRTIPGDLLSRFSQLNLLDVIGRKYEYHGEYIRGKNRIRRRRPSVEELSCLEGGLKALGITVVSVSTLRWLSSLQCASIWHLELTELEDLFEPLQLLSQDLLGSRNIKSSMKELLLSHCDSLVELVMEYEDGYETHDEQNQSRQWGFERLEVLKFSHLGSMESILWKGVDPMVLLPCLLELTIDHCHKLKHLSWVLTLPSLESLKLDNCYGLTAVIQEAGDHGNASSKFSSLRILVLANLLTLRSISAHSLAFPSLEYLQLSGCPSLERLPFSRDIAIYGKLREIKSRNHDLDRLKWQDEDVKKFAYDVLNPMSPSPPKATPAAAANSAGNADLPPATLLGRTIFWSCSHLQGLVILLSFPLFFMILSTKFPTSVVFLCFIVILIIIWRLREPEEDWQSY